MRYAGLKAPNGPIGSFLFLDPTGVGKTELVCGGDLQSLPSVFMQFYAMEQ